MVSQDLFKWQLHGAPSESISTSCLSSLHLPDFFLFETRGASTGARPVSVGWDLHESSCFTCSLLLPTLLACLIGTTCKGRQGVALQHRAKRRLFQSQHNNPVVQILWKHCHWLIISGYIATDFAAYCGMRVSCAVSVGKESKDRFGPKTRNGLWGTEIHFDWMMIQWCFHTQRIQVDFHCWNLKILWGCPAFSCRHNWDRMGSSLLWVPKCVTGWGCPLWGCCCPKGCPQPPALSQLGCHAHVTKKSHHNPNLRICSDSSNNEELVKVLNWVLFYFVGEYWGFYFFFNFTSSDWFSSTFGVK